MKNKACNITHGKRYIGNTMMKIRLDKTCIDALKGLSRFSMASQLTSHV